MHTEQQTRKLSAILPDSDGRYYPCPTVMTEEELIQFLRLTLRT